MRIISILSILSLLVCTGKSIEKPKEKPVLKRDNSFFCECRNISYYSELPPVCRCECSDGSIDTEHFCEGR